jgi:hypothetical protein
MFSSMSSNGRRVKPHPMARTFLGLGASFAASLTLRVSLSFSPGSG